MGRYRFEYIAAKHIIAPALTVMRRLARSSGPSCSSGPSGDVARYTEKWRSGKYLAHCEGIDVVHAERSAASLTRTIRRFCTELHAQGVLN
jgi:hypothetical protein